jgi:hypothetical protein
MINHIGGPSLLPYITETIPTMIDGESTQLGGGTFPTIEKMITLLQGGIRYLHDEVGRLSPIVLDHL